MSIKSKNNILLIMAQDGFLYKGSLSEGYCVCHPYKQCNLLGRIIREFIFRFFPILSYLFYTEEIFKGDWDKIVIWDPLITRQFLDKIHKAYPNAQLDFVYWNMVGKCRHLKPSQIPGYVRKWTYDDYDSKRYGLNLYSTYPYYKTFIREHIDNRIDVLFVGKDKGRGEYLLELERKLQDLGLKTKFIITKSDRLAKNKNYYQNEISYSQICDYISHSRSVLNVVMENQEGLTLRDLEYVYQGVKLLTTNQMIVNNPIYNPSNVFVIKDMNLIGIKEFLFKERVSLPIEVMEHHTFDSFIKEITSAHE